MNRAPRRADSLDRVEVLMALEEKHPGLSPAFETLWDWDRDFDEKAAVPLHPFVAKPFSAKALRNGFVTQVTVIACYEEWTLGLDEVCHQFATGTLSDERELNDVRHYPTLELGSRAFLAEVERRMASNNACMDSSGK